MLMNQSIRYLSNCKERQVQDCVIQECTALKVYSSTCSIGFNLKWQKIIIIIMNKGTSCEVMWALLQHFNACLLRASFLAIL